MSFRGIAQPCARSPVRGIDFNLFAGLGVFQRDQADVRKHFFTFILHPNGNEIMSSAGYSQGLRKIRCLEIRNEKYHRAASDKFVEVIKSQRWLGAAALRLEK